VTVDDAAKEAAISKKTLYRYFENKDKLVIDVVKDHFEEESAEFAEIKFLAKDAIHELILVSRCIRKHVCKTNPSLPLDMQKFHGSAWNEYLNFKQTTIKGRVEDNIRRGIERGYSRREVEPEILSIFRVEAVQILFNPDVFPTNKFDFPTVQLQIMDHFINRLLTDKGRKRGEEYNQSENQIAYAE